MNYYSTIILHMQPCPQDPTTSKSWEWDLGMRLLLLRCNYVPYMPSSRLNQDYQFLGQTWRSSLMETRTRSERKKKKQKHLSNYYTDVESKSMFFFTLTIFVYNNNNITISALNGSIYYYTV